MNLILTTATEPQGLEVTLGEARLHHPAPECEGEIAARERLEPEGPLMPAKAKSAGRTKRRDRAESTPTVNECQIIYLDDRWWFIRPSGQWVGPYRAQLDAERKAAP